MADNVPKKLQKRQRSPTKEEVNAKKTKVVARSDAATQTEFTPELRFVKHNPTLADPESSAEKRQRSPTKEELHAKKMKVVARTDAATQTEFKPELHFGRPNPSLTDPDPSAECTTIQWLDEHRSKTDKLKGQVSRLSYLLKEYGPKLADKGSKLKSSLDLKQVELEHHNSMEGTLAAIYELYSQPPEPDYSDTPCIPVYVMLPLDAINMKCELVDPKGLRKQLQILKLANVDGIVVDCWWGIVEAHAPKKYNWNGYKRLFRMVCELKLKLKVVMCFHECGGSMGDDVCIPLPHWVADIGRSNPEIFFTDRAGRRNLECLSWGIDKERVLRGRTALEVYYDYMRSFRVEFDEFFEGGIISMIEVGLGPCGELSYPSNPLKHGWRFPGVGEFQCYDQYLLKSMRKAAEMRGHSCWAHGPDNAGSYNSQPHETDFFCDEGDYNSPYGRFFLDWYSRVLVDHGDRVLSIAKLAFDDTFITAKIPGVYWMYKTESHAAELTAGFYNPHNRDGYYAITEMLKKQGAALNFTCSELGNVEPGVDLPLALGNPDGLFWQVLNAAWDACLSVTSGNARPCLNKESFNHMLEKAKPLSDPDGRHLHAFTYLRLSPLLMETDSFKEFERFIKKMHGSLAQSDQRRNVSTFLVQAGIVKKEHINIHGF